MNSLIPLLATYAHKVAPNKEWALNELYLLQEQAKAHYIKELGKTNFNKHRLAILKANGFTHKTWEKVLNMAGSFYFIPTPEMDKCNREIKELTKKYTLINAIALAKNYFSLRLKKDCSNKKPSFIRTKIQGRWSYKVNPAIL